MEEIILGLILTEGVITVNDISRKTGFTKKEVLSSLSYLERKGLLNYKGKEKNTCQHCPLSKICKIKDIRGGFNVRHFN